MSGFRVALVVFLYYLLGGQMRRAVEALTEAGNAVDVISFGGNGEPRKE